MAIASHHFSALADGLPHLAGGSWIIPGKRSMRGSGLMSERPAAGVLVPRLLFWIVNRSNPTTHYGSVGYDAAKNIKGRKRHLLLDTPRLVLGVLVTSANVPEREGGQTLLGRTLNWFGWLRLLWADGG